MGSPPRGRGKVNDVESLLNRVGITPAWAGKSPAIFKIIPCIEDHPRVGGEKFFSVSWPTMKAGSPPRGRGKVHREQGHHHRPGITPAWAGKRVEYHRTKAPCEDHPRVGGEKTRPIKPLLVTTGSPPRGRGKASKRHFPAVIVGITPAWAGKRLKRSHRSGIFISGPIPFHSVLHRPAGSGGSRAGRDGAPAGQPQNAGPA